MNKAQLHSSIIENSRLTFSRSGGNGGQNVNKVNTKVHLTLLPEQLDGITEEERGRIKEKLSSIINAEGEIFISVADERTRERNRAIALSRIENRIVNALEVPKKRKKTKPTKASKERRRKLKKIKSEIKKNRGKVW